MPSTEGYGLRGVWLYIITECCCRFNLCKWHSPLMHLQFLYSPIFEDKCEMDSLMRHETLWDCVRLRLCETFWEFVRLVRLCETSETWGQQGALIQIYKYALFVSLLPSNPPPPSQKYQLPGASVIVFITKSTPFRLPALAWLGHSPLANLGMFFILSFVKLYSMR